MCDTKPSGISALFLFFLPLLALPLPFRGMPPQMERYIVQGGDVNKPNKLGDTPLHEVRSSGSGVRVMLQPEKQQALFLA